MHSVQQKGQIWREFQRLLADRRPEDSRIMTKEQMAAREQEKAVVETASTYTVENIVTGLADFQLTFDRTIDQLTTQLTNESVKLEDVQKAIQVEKSRLQEIHHIDIAANTLDILIQEHDAKKQILEIQRADWQETFSQEITVQRDAWQKEQEVHEALVQEYNELLQNERATTESDQVYNTERTRKIELDRYETKKRDVERTHAQEERRRTKEWAAREQVLEARQEELQEYQAKIDSFPDELEKEIKTARDEAIKKANQKAKVQADLLAKEVEASKKVYELRTQTLERMIETQNQDIQALSAELKEALQKVQELANKAMIASHTLSA